MLKKLSASDIIIYVLKRYFLFGINSRIDSIKNIISLFIIRLYSLGHIKMSLKLLSVVFVR